jgi:hypothetical protein
MQNAVRFQQPAWLRVDQVKYVASRRRAPPIIDGCAADVLHCAGAARVNEGIGILDEHCGFNRCYTEGHFQIERVLGMDIDDALLGAETLSRRFQPVHSEWKHFERMPSVGSGGKLASNVGTLPNQCSTRVHRSARWIYDYNAEFSGIPLTYSYR